MDFAEMLDQLNVETINDSSPNQMRKSPTFQMIKDMGQEAVPMLEAAMADNHPASLVIEVLLGDIEAGA